MLNTIGDGNAAALIGLLGGIMLGLAARLGRFCTLGAIEDALYGGNDLRLRMWGIAIGVAVIGSFGLLGLGVFDPAASIYLSFTWLPVASIAGGLMFGYGMALAGNCGFGALARLGGGDLRNFVIVVVMGLASYATLSGPLALIRVALFEQGLATRVPGIAHDLAAVTGFGVAPVGIGIGLILLAMSIAPARVRSSGKTMFWGAVVGLSAVLAWGGTYWIAQNGFDGTPVVSHTFSAPIGDALFWGMTASADLSLNFGIGSVAGVWLGAFAGSLLKGHFRWEACEDPRELRRQIFGAALMGVGAVIAFGCSIGQGLSAFSVLAWSAPVTVLAMIAGAAFGLRQLITGFAPAE